jgi:hypothetical protein
MNVSSDLILRKLEERLNPPFSFGEAFAMVGGLVISLVLNVVIWAGIYSFIVFRSSYGSSRYSSLPALNLSWDLHTCIIVVVAGVILSMVLSGAQRNARLGATVGMVTAPPRFLGYSRGGEADAGGCLGSILDFLGGSILACIGYFFRTPPLSRNQLVVATAVVSCCLQQPGVGVNVVHESILPGHPNLTEADFEKSLAVLRQKGVLDGQSYINVSGDFYEALKNG